MRLLRDLRLTIKELADGKGITFFDDEGQLVRSESDVLALKKKNIGDLDLAPTPGPGDVEQVPFGDVATAHFLLLVSDQDLTMKVNGGSDVFKLTKAPGTGLGRAMLYWEGEFTAVELTNPGTAESTVLYAVLGV